MPSGSSVCCSSRARLSCCACAGELRGTGRADHPRIHLGQDVLVPRPSRALHQPQRERHPPAGQRPAAAGRALPDDGPEDARAKRRNGHADSSEPQRKEEQSEDRHGDLPPREHQIPLKPKGLGLLVTLTPHHQGFDNEQCGTAARVLVRLRLTSTAGTPTHALLAVRNDNAKKRPIAFYNWSPDKVNVYTGKSCTSSS